MAKFKHISTDLQQFIEKQKVFFVGTAAATGKINVSPKGTDTFRVINDKRVVWLNLTGSGNETAAHVLQNNRMTIMFCAFEDKPLIVRLFGKANIYHMRDEEFNQYIHLFEPNTGSRQIFEIDLEMVQTACGFGVPLLGYKEDRSILNDWSNKQGTENIKAYWKEKNTHSLDGFETNILDD